MSKKKILTIAVAAALLTGGAAAQNVTTVSNNDVLVMFKPGVSKQQREAAIKQHGASLRQLDAQGRDVKMRYVADGRIIKVTTPKNTSRDALIKKLASHPAIEVAEPDFPLRALAVPNDSSFGELWGLLNTGQSGGTAGADIKATDAWDISTGSHDVIIGIIDTGMDYNHPDLIDNRWVNPGNLPGSTYGYSALNAELDPMDSDSHGTHVAGTIGASGNNGVGVAGVNWNVTLLPCQFLGPSGGSTAGAIECINYFTDLKVNHGVDIKATNNSWGGGGFSETLRAAIQSGGDAGILFIAASGNDGGNADSAPMYPAAYDLDVIVSVASTDRNDNMSGFSNYGATSVDLAAPGSDILSTVPGASYASYSGTSMASPHVAGAAALLWSVNPDLSAAEMKAILMNSGDSLPALDGKTVSGKRINLANAMLEADPTPSFKLTLSPRSQQITAGESTQYTLDIGNIADWMGEVALSLDVAPELNGVSLSASTAQPGQSLTLDVTTTTETAWGSYQFTVTGTDSATGELVKSVNASLNVLPQGLQDYPYSNDTVIAIPDNDAAGISSVINVPQAGAVFGVNVGVDITHTWQGDLLVMLRSPTGTEHTLHNRTGGSADDLVQSWQVSSYNGESMQGDWTLLVSDNAGIDTGALNSWQLTLTALSDDGTPPGPIAPTADFSYVSSGLNVNFTDLSTDPDDDISIWSWQFGDGNTSSAAAPQHSYTAAGTYQVSLMVTDSTGLTDTLVQAVSVTASDNDLALTLHRSVRTRTGSTIVDLRWTGTADTVDIYRDNQLVTSTDANGRYRDRFNSQAATVSYKICLAGTDSCSADLLVNF
ncbi:S8 family serine peptidase [Rheinheimera maricola]|uniref:S8 family serine peptidase n=1 Tax=Rheinheimera maricola TaxID=2793282 RepID=A0ABS7X630_9GAMM|nr:S8 family serine peptidase [Rheinheimera maricola]MBZ9611005.1 S8 family serine peptidase [Rheinheimera maricola]